MALNNNIILKAILTVALATAVPAVASSCKGGGSTTENKNSDSISGISHKGGKIGGPQLGSPGGGPAIDKSADATLQAMIKAVVPEFKQFSFSDTVTGKSMAYNLFVPKRHQRRAICHLFCS